MFTVQTNLIPSVTSSEFLSGIHALLGPQPYWESWNTHTSDPSLGFPHSSVGKESAFNAGDPGSVPESARSAGEGIGYPLQYSWASLVTELVKNPPAMRETWVQSMGWEDPLERGKATHSSILAKRIPWTVCVAHEVAKSWTCLSGFQFLFSGSQPVWVEAIYQGDCHQIENRLVTQGNPLTPDIFQCPHKSLPISSNFFLGSCIFEARKYHSLASSICSNFRIISIHRINTLLQTNLHHLTPKWLLLSVTMEKYN